MGGELSYGSKHWSWKNCLLNEMLTFWLLLNVMDPSSKQIMGDFYTNQGIKAETIGGFYFGASLAKKGQQSMDTIEMCSYIWDGWDQPTYHERLKPSYYILQGAFAKYKK